MREFSAGWIQLLAVLQPADAALQEIALTHYDRPTRQSAYFAIQELLAKDNPMIFIYWLRQMEPISVDFQGLRSESGRRVLERVAMDHISLPELTWLRKIIVERALTRGDYVLAGGARSDYYIDKFSLFSDPHVLRRIARLFTPVIAELNPDLIAGTELGGVVIATAVSQMSGLPMLAVRKKPKAYGAFANEYVEGPYASGQHALLLEDVVSNAGDLMAAPGACASSA